MVIGCRLLSAVPSGFPSSATRVTGSELGRRCVDDNDVLVVADELLLLLLVVVVVVVAVVVDDDDDEENMEDVRQGFKALIF